MRGGFTLIQFLVLEDQNLTNYWHYKHLVLVILTYLGITNEFRCSHDRIGELFSWCLSAGKKDGGELLRSLGKQEISPDEFIDRINREKYN